MKYALNSLGFTLFFLVFFPLLSFAGQKVTAEGMSFFESGQEKIAKEKALNEAKRHALEKVLGAQIESQTLVENYQVVRDQIFSHVSGYIKNLKIIKDEVTEMGTYEVSIEAEVEEKFLARDLERFEKIVQWQQNPRILVTTAPDLDSSYIPSAHKAAGLMSRKLKSRGFIVYKPNDTDSPTIGLSVTLSVQAETHTTDYQGMDLSTNEVGLSALVSRMRDGEILATSSAVTTMPGENRMQALDQGITTCVDKVWKDLQKQLTRLWEEELYNQRNVILIVQDISSHTRARKIAELLHHGIHGMKSVQLISYAENTGEYGLLYRGWPEYLANQLEMTYFAEKYFPAKVQSVTDNRIIINLEPYE